MKKASRLSATANPASRARAVEPARPKQTTRHPERPPDRGHEAADPAVGVDAERFPYDACAQRTEPEAGFQPFDLLRNVAQGREDQPPGEFGGGVGRTGPARRHHDTALRAGVE